MATLKCRHICFPVLKQSIFFLFVFVSQLVFGQNCDHQLFGLVLDLHERTPLEQVKVTVIETNQQLLTDEEGKFLFFGLCKGQYTLSFEHPNCITTTQKHTLQS